MKFFIAMQVATPPVHGGLVPVDLLL